MKDYDNHHYADSNRDSGGSTPKLNQEHRELTLDLIQRSRGDECLMVKPPKSLGEIDIMYYNQSSDSEEVTTDETAIGFR